jgi:hypothetical protein
MRQEAKQKMNIKTLALVVGNSFRFALFGGCGTTDDGTKDTGTKDTSTDKTCTIQINCSLLLGQDLEGTGLETLVPKDGVILDHRSDPSARRYGI